MMISFYDAAAFLSLTFFVFLITKLKFKLIQLSKRESHLTNEKRSYAKKKFITILTCFFDVSTLSFVFCVLPFSFVLAQFYSSSNTMLFETEKNKG